ncbi:MAG: helix-turn-helix domain-containing protein [Opitutaceae bacterium]|nr:helix-turn-helix domain-containing protein [Opitutaceae bacterium]
MEIPTPSIGQPHESSLRERAALVARLQSSDIFRDYQRAFQAITGLPLAMRAATSFQAPMQGTTRGNAFCSLMASRSKTCSACLLVQQKLEAAATQRAETMACFGGLHESAVPIRVGENVVAYLQTGQVLFQAPSAAESRQAARQASELDRTLDRAGLEAAYRESRVVSRAQYESTLRLLEIFAQQLSALSNELMVKQALAEAPAVTRARAYIAAHLAEDISLPQVARAVGMSPFYFCKNFKKGTGLTFIEYLSRMRVETVKQLLLNPYKRVSEAAYEAGFQSLSQFNRVFHRITGQPPSVYREHLHGAAAGTHAHAA